MHRPPAFAFLVAGSLAVLTACGQSSESAGTNKESAASETGEAEVAPTGENSYTAVGSVTAISGNQVTIAHEAVEDLKWPAMTMDFQAQNLDQVADLKPGDRIEFTFSQAGDDYILTAVKRLGE